MTVNKEHSFVTRKMNFPFIKKQIINIQKLSAVNKNKKRIKLSDRFNKKRPRTM